MADKSLSSKVVLLGESGVGKTCIISRYINDRFDEKTVSTNGASYGSKSITVNSKVIRMDIWDTAGQEKFRSMAKFFYKDATIAILVYDITRIDSFNAIKKFWYEQLKLHALKDIVIGIAGNKADMFDKEEVSEQEARDFANKIGAQFRLTSAFENTGIDELFLSVVHKFLDPSFQDTIGNLGKKGDGKKIVLNQDPKTGKIKKKDGCC